MIIPVFIEHREQKIDSPTGIIFFTISDTRSKYLDLAEVARRLENSFLWRTT